MFHQGWGVGEGSVVHDYDKQRSMSAGTLSSSMHSTTVANALPGSGAVCEMPVILLTRDVQRSSMIVSSNRSTLTGASYDTDGAVFERETQINSRCPFLLKKSQQASHTLLDDLTSGQLSKDQKR